jgi:hypothetical protein
MLAMRDWHRVFSVSLADVVTGLPFRVVQEFELSRLKQRLDTAIICLTEAQVSEHFWPDLPDGLTDLADHNLLSYKSMRESLTCASMWELVSYGVIYAKQQWKKGWAEAVQDRTKLKLIAVTTHRPAWLTPGCTPPPNRLADGVEEIELLELIMRILVPREMVKTPRNALWHLLSGDAELVRYGMEHYQARDGELYNVLNDLRETYSMEGLEVPYTKEDYKQEVARELFQKIPPNERRELFQKMPPNERRELFQKMPPNERRELFQKMPPNERRELLRDLPADERLSGLSAEQIERYLKELRRTDQSENDVAERN